MEQVWMLDRLAITLACVDFLDPELVGQVDARERGVRLELRRVDAATTGSIYASPGRVLQPAVCRIDLLESAPYAADRMHWHPQMESGEPGDRTFDVTMVEDPLHWLGDHLHHADHLLSQSGVTLDDELRRDLDALPALVPAIVAAAEEGLTWARVDPWPDAVHDERGMAVSR